jgi:predicted XRE-type DNA-binding protein
LKKEGMIKKFENIAVIDNRKLYDEVSSYGNALIDEATANSMLELEADNEYTREIGRVGVMCAIYESTYMKFKHLKFKSPLVISIEQEMKNRNIKQRQAAKLLDVKESTFSLIIRGKRPVSMQMAKRLYKVFNIDPKLILEYS